MNPSSGEFSREVAQPLLLLLCDLVVFSLRMLWQFGAKLARVQSSAQRGQQLQQQGGPSLLPQSVYKKVSSAAAPWPQPGLPATTTHKEVEEVKPLSDQRVLDTVLLRV